MHGLRVLWTSGRGVIPWIVRKAQRGDPRSHCVVEVWGYCIHADILRGVRLWESQTFLPHHNIVAEWQGPDLEESEATAIYLFMDMLKGAKPRFSILGTLVWWLTGWGHPTNCVNITQDILRVYGIPTKDLRTPAALAEHLKGLSRGIYLQPTEGQQPSPDSTDQAGARDRGLPS